MLQGSGASFMFGLAVGSIPMMSMAVFGSANNCFEKPRPSPTGGVVAGGGEIACSSTSTSTATSRSIGSRRRMGNNNVDGGRGKTCPSVMLVKDILPSLILR
ncbi:hypothetical protein KY290_014373 [Solanum tuberosum]|uniref:Secreted protein n=1 Tax=Solanum tuberosum TaxID=4113 RepID=A0ABQ7VPF2_SOLTU|nr:hypothetical protein KY289_014432 [Solanum tuberosum]KAH0699564.1 hypothetical protein KY284_013779 [Solanum tuberosum]KAH0770392.1 hypothetical protein KY290_014373 [Solanum tuberosum]